MKQCSTESPDPVTGNATRSLRFVAGFRFGKAFHTTLLRSDQVSPFVFCEAAPDAVWLSNPHRVLEAFGHHRADPANSACPNLSPRSLIFSLKGARGKEQMRMVAPAQRTQMPRVVDCHRLPPSLRHRECAQATSVTVVTKESSSSK